MASVNDGSLTGVHFEAFADSSTMLEDPRGFAHGSMPTATSTSAD